MPHCSFGRFKHPAAIIVKLPMIIPGEDLKAFLDQKSDQYNSVEFIETDPVSVPRNFTKKEDIEIAGFMAAAIAWGQRVTIIRNATTLMQWMDNAPYDFILHFNDSDLQPFRKFIHRTFNGIDCEYFMWSLKNIYQRFGSMENAFGEGFAKREPHVKNAIINFRQRFFELEHPGRTEKHIANPSKKASAKRINMYLRWMVRKDNKGVDFGIWDSIRPDQLICPLDVHVAAVARKLGLLERKINDWQAAEDLTLKLRELNPEDPVKYDFALFGLGIFEKF